MSLTTLFFISSGIFLGWSLGANHAVNVFGTAVMSKMVRYRTAAIVAGVFVTLGAVFGGAGTTRTLNQLGAVNALAASFTVAFAVGVAVAWMTYLKLPVSTSQAIVGGVIGWNFFTGSPTDVEAIFKILGTWVTSPLLAALFAFLLFKFLEHALKKARIHMLEIDAYTRSGLLLVGALASYTLGANNIANVMGLFVSAAPFSDITFAETLTFTGTQQLFLLGGLSIAIGIYTYGQHVMVTVGSDLYRITPLSGLVVVLAESIVLFLFSSQTLEAFLRRLHLPTIPLAPLSSTQAVIGAVVGVGMAKQGRMINFHVLGKIAAGWVSAPLVAFVLTFVSLFFVQNVFEQRVVADSAYQVSPSVLAAAEEEGVSSAPLQALLEKRFASSNAFRRAVAAQHRYNTADLTTLMRLARIDSFVIDSTKIAGLPLAPEQVRGLYALHGRVFLHRGDLERTLATQAVQSDTLTRSLVEGLTPMQLEALLAALRVHALSSANHP